MHSLPLVKDLGMELSGDRRGMSTSGKFVK